MWQYQRFWWCKNWMIRIECVYDDFERWTNSFQCEIYYSMSIWANYSFSHIFSRSHVYALLACCHRLFHNSVNIYSGTQTHTHTLLIVAIAFRCSCCCRCYWRAIFVQANKLLYRMCIAPMFGSTDNIFTSLSSLCVNGKVDRNTGIY